VDKLVENLFYSLDLVKKLIHKNIRRNIYFAFVLFIVIYTFLFRLCIFNLIAWRIQSFWRRLIDIDVDCFSVFIFIFCDFSQSFFLLFDENCFKVKNIGLCFSMPAYNRMKS